MHFLVGFVFVLAMIGFVFGVNAAKFVAGLALLAGVVFCVFIVYVIVANQ